MTAKQTTGLHAPDGSEYVTLTDGAGNLVAAGSTTIGAGSAIIGKVGIDQTTPGTTNGVQVNAALPAGTNLIGKTGIDQTTPGTTNGVVVNSGSLTSSGYGATVTLTRTSDTNAYTANDVIGAATGSTAALTFASMGPSGGQILITSARLEIDASAIISGETSYNLYLYSVTPPSALGDNVAFDIPSGDRASYLGKISLGTPVDEGSTLNIETDIINKQIKLAGTSLFGYLVTVGAYTPTSARVYSITLNAIAL